MRHAAAVGRYVLSITTLFLLYVTAVWVASGPALPGGAGLVFGFAALFQGLAVLAPHMLSGDLYSYAMYGRMVALYGGNPYLEVPAQYPGDLYYQQVYWKFVPSFYGPLWTLVSGGIAGLAGDDVARAVLLFRGLAAASAVGSAVLAAFVLARLTPRSVVPGTLLLAWNPLVVVEAGLGGHNDALMVLLITVGVALIALRRPSLAIGALVLAGLVKLVALVLVPLVGMYVLRQQSWRERRLFAVRSAALTTVLGAAIIAPVWAGPATFAAGTLGASGDRYVNGLGELALGELRVWLGDTRQDTEVPLQFSGWWVATHVAAPMRARRDDQADLLIDLPQWSELLVVGPERGGWLRVFDPRDRVVGYVRSAALGPAERPVEYDGDPDVLARERGPQGSLALQQANTLVRLVGWGGFGLVWLGAILFRTGSFSALTTGCLATFMALFYLASAWFWPWYVVWALPFAALAPRSRLGRWTVFLSWGVLLLYALLGFGETNLWYLQTYRSLPIFGLPLALLMLDEAARAVVALVTRSPSVTRPDIALAPAARRD